MKSEREANYLPCLWRIKSTIFKIKSNYYRAAFQCVCSPGVTHKGGEMRVSECVRTFLPVLLSFVSATISELFKFHILTLSFKCREVVVTVIAPLSIVDAYTWLTECGVVH